MSPILLFTGQVHSAVHGPDCSVRALYAGVGAPFPLVAKSNKLWKKYRKIMSPIKHIAKFQACKTIVLLKVKIVKTSRRHNGDY